MEKKNSSIIKIIVFIVVAVLAFGGGFGVSLFLNIKKNTEVSGVESTDVNKMQTDEDNHYVGYISEDALINGQITLASMPEITSETKALDSKIAKNMVDQFANTDRWLLATYDAELEKDSGTQCHFNCQLGVTVSKEGTPHLYALLSRIYTDAEKTADIPKSASYRQRPYAEAIEKEGAGSNYATTCRPDQEEKLKYDSSYPSGHATFGFLAGLVLAQVDPQDATKLIARGRQYSESRLVCNFQWYSDIQAGRELAASVFSILQSQPQYLADIKAAQKEFQKEKEKNLKPTIDYKITPDFSVTRFKKEALKEINDQFLNKDCDWERKTLETSLTKALAR